MKATKRILSALVASLVLLTACSSNSASSTPEAASNAAGSTAETNYIGNNLKYDLNAPVNNGEKISLSIWTDPEIEPFYKAITDKYTQIHPNVSFQIVVQPWDDYWTKIALALSSGAGPDIYRPHAGYVNNLKQYTRPLDSSILPQEQLIADFPSITELAVDGNFYSAPLGFTFGAGIYYNKGMWAEAGLTEADIPKDWNKFIEVGKKLTKTDGKGNITQYGFSIDHAFENFLVDCNYTRGQALFKSDLASWNLDNEATYQNVEMIRSFKDEHKFMMYSDGDCEDQFGHGQAAMMYNVSWVGGYFNETYPDVDWGFFMLPTEDGETPPAYGQKMNEWTMSVSATDDKKAAVAFDLFKYYLCEENTYLDHAIRISVVPAKDNLKSSERLNDYENLKIAAQYEDRLVYFGVIPTDEARQKGLRAAGSDIFVNGKDPKSVISKLQSDLTDDAKRNNFTIQSVENNYGHYDQLKK